MLRYFLENNLLNITDEHPETWEEAIRVAGKVMKQDKLVTDDYIDSVIADVKKYGPYIVIVPGVAMPHSKADSEGVLGTGIGLTILPEPVSFDESDPDKSAKLFFMLAAKDNNTHVKNIAHLSDMLMEDNMIYDLSKVKNLDDYKAVMKKHNM
ncbi:PTS sugar transporter subunit IIA [Lactobacillus crispatus]|uniref:PTS sugar transporter subunit IIA n=1 Tax=Lactobacillus crispatus TaxID=47770 RepID=UPI000763EDCD|nr:PTS sugar transporter subunit IIA [Lactobacillus crispatus]KWX58313.1 PTS ascorbate transporter subunit IIA [Lactobacillus crispatus]MCZ9642797.1 PTS sugar transporter subunit IIA [Lactobacillus crispatus]